MNPAGKAVRDNARLTYQQGLRVARKEAALRVYDDTGCSSLGFPFVASDTRLLGPEDDASDAGFTTVYDCLCPACVEARPA